MGVIIGILFVAFLVFVAVKSSNSPAAVKARDEAAARQAKIVCPHCQTAGCVTSRQVTKKKGISGGKATGAVLTGGVSMLATGLSRKENSTAMSCSNCGTTWYV